VIDRLQPVLKQFAAADDFIKGYDITEANLQSFIMYASKKIDMMDPRELILSRPVIKTLVKANAARFKWGNNAYYQVLNENDNAFKVALKQ
jgi:carboxyl-terminal processing protease